MRGERHEIFVVSDFNVVNHNEDFRGKSNSNRGIETAATTYHQIKPNYFIK